MPSSLPPALLNRLRKDEQESNKYLAVSSVEDSIQPVKQSAERKLLSITNKAVDTLEEVLDFGAPKERLAAAEAILDRSPATKQMVAGSTQDQSIPAEALGVLMEGLGKMFSMVVDHRHTELKRAVPVIHPIGETNEP